MNRLIPLVVLLPLIGGCAVVPYNTEYHTPVSYTVAPYSVSYPVSYPIYYSPFPRNVPLTFGNYGRYMLGVGGYKGGHRWHGRGAGVHYGRHH